MRRLAVLILCLILPSCLMAQGMVTLGLLGGGVLIYETMQGEEAKVRTAWTGEASAGYLFRLSDSILLGPQAGVVWTGRTNIVHRNFYAASIQGELALALLFETEGHSAFSLALAAGLGSCIDTDIFATSLKLSFQYHWRIVKALSLTAGLDAHLTHDGPSAVLSLGLTTLIGVGQ